MAINPVTNIRYFAPKRKISNGVNVIIFDLGNVVLKFDIHLISGKIAKRFSIDEDKIFELFFDSKITHIHDEGKINAKEFHKKVVKELDIKMGFKDFKTIWNNIFTENSEVTKLILKLSKRYKIFLMSNTNKLHFDYIKTKFDIIKEFDRIFTSYEIGRLKPHPKIYKTAIKVARTEPANIVYIDDRKELVKGAKKLGIMAIQFKNIRQLKKDLTKNGVNIN